MALSLSPASSFTSSTHTVDATEAFGSILPKSCWNCARRLFISSIRSIFSSGSNAPERTKFLYISSSSTLSSPFRLFRSLSYTFFTRSKKSWLKLISFSNSVSSGIAAFSAASISGVLLASVMQKKMFLTLSSSSPLFSNAKIVFWNVGFCLFATICSISARCSSIPIWMAGR